MNQTERIHGLDALRAVLMLLGVFLHATLAYLAGLDWGAQDPDNQAHWPHVVLDGIHLFRMPAFFVISGFFGALLLERRGLGAMMKNRWSRIFLPLLVFL